MRVVDLKGHYSAPDWAMMASPIAPPASADERQRITVWLRVPRGAKLGARFDASQRRWLLTYPPGTSADRVELRIEGTHAEALDIRGTDLLPSGERFHVLRRDPRGGGMIGYAWMRGDESAEDRADRALEPIVRGDGGDLAFFRANMRCARCHVHDEPGLEKTGGPRPPMATDCGGFYRITTVLEDTAPLVESRDHDVNLDSPFVSIRCPSGPPSVTRTPGGVARAKCQRGDVPVATYDMKGAVTAGDPHARRVCASRAYLFERLDRAARKAFTEAFSACGMLP